MYVTGSHYKLYIRIRTLVDKGCKFLLIFFGTNILFSDSLLLGFGQNNPVLFSPLLGKNSPFPPEKW